MGKLGGAEKEEKSSAGSAKKSTKGGYDGKGRNRLGHQGHEITV